MYYNFRQALDPIANVRKFSPSIMGAEGYFSEVLHHFYDKNVHSFTHYLEHPAVHGSLLRSAGKGNLPLSKFRAAIRAYGKDGPKQFGGDFATINQVRRLEQSVNEIAAPNLEDPEEFLNQLKYIETVFKTLEP